MTGNVPGCAKHTAQTFLLGVFSSGSLRQPQNILVAVMSSACTSKPMVARYIYIERIPRRRNTFQYFPTGQAPPLLPPQRGDNGVTELFDQPVVKYRDDLHLPLKPFYYLFYFLRGPGIGLGQDNKLLLVLQLPVPKAGNLVPDSFVVLQGVLGFQRYAMDEHFGPRNMTEKLGAQALPLRRALYKPRDIGEHKAVERPEVWVERGKGVCPHLGCRAGQSIKERGLARVGEPDKPRVGDKPQLDMELGLLAGHPRRALHRAGVDRRLKHGVARPSPAAAQDQLFFVLGKELVHLAGSAVAHNRADRQVDDQVFAAFAVAVIALAVVAASRLKLFFAPVAAQERYVAHGMYVDAAAVAAVATRGAGVLLALQVEPAHDAVAPLARPREYLQFINKSHS